MAKWLNEFDRAYMYWHCAMDPECGERAMLAMVNAILSHKGMTALADLDTLREPIRRAQIKLEDSAEDAYDKLEAVVSRVYSAVSTESTV